MSFPKNSFSGEAAQHGRPLQTPLVRLIKFYTGQVILLDIKSNNIPGILSHYFIETYHLFQKENIYVKVAIKLSIKLLHFH